MTVEPIRPEQVISHKAKIIPDKIIEIFNDLIAKQYDGRKATVSQESALRRITTAMDCDRHTVFANKWLDVEEIYRAQGWKVYYDKPAYCENYEPYFEFSKN